VSPWHRCDSSRTGTPYHRLQLKLTTGNLYLAKDLVLTSVACTQMSATLSGSSVEQGAETWKSAKPPVPFATRSGNPPAFV